MESRSPRLIGEDFVKCPVCGKKKLKLSIFIYEAPYIGNVVLESGRCLNCGYKWSDVGMLDFSEPKRIIIEVNGLKELNALVVKAAPATVRIPELGIEITPGPAAQGYITTVEGILYRVLDHVPSECLDPNAECHKKVQLIRDAADGRVKFTLIIDDPSGRSAVSGKDVKVVEEPLPPNQKQHASEEKQ